MKEHPIENLMLTAMESIRSMIDVNTIIGEPMDISSDITITTTAIGYKGVTQVTPTIGTIPSVTGMTITKNKNVITITAKAGKTLSDNGSVQIPIIIDGKTFNRAFSWTKSKNGKNGKS